MSLYIDPIELNSVSATVVCIVVIQMEREMEKLGLGQRASSPQFSINISVSPESSPGPDTPLYGT